MQYPPPLNNYLNTLNFNKSCLFYHGYKHDTKNYYILKKIERLIQYLIKKEIQPKQRGKKVDTSHNALSNIR